MDQPLDTAHVPLYSDFAFNTGSVLSATMSTAGFGAGQFIVSRTTQFTSGETVTLSYTPNAGDASKHLQNTTGDEVLAFTNQAVNNTL